MGSASRPGYTEKTRAWLERRFHVDPGQVYTAHQPIYGVGAHEAQTEPDHLWRVAKTLQLMRVLARVRCSTLLDLGAAEGYTAMLASRLFGLDATVADVSREAMLRSRELFGLPGVALNASNLPFRDDAFDVVLCAECIEHLEHPFEMILEASRVAARCLIIATVESRASYWASRLALYGLPVDEAHGHRSVWSRKDFEMMFGRRVRTATQNAPRPWTPAEPARLLKTVAVPPPPPHLGEGIVMHVLFDPAIERREPSIPDDELIDRLLRFRIELQPLAARCDDGDLRAGLLSRLRCPACRRGALAPGDRALACRACGKTFPVAGGVPDLFTPRPADLEELAAQPKLGLDPAARRRVRWARRRTKQFDRGTRIRSPRIAHVLRRFIRMLELLDAQQGLAGKGRFLLAALALPFRRARRLEGVP